MNRVVIIEEEQIVITRVKQTIIDLEDNQLLPEDEFVDEPCIDCEELVGQPITVENANDYAITELFPLRFEDLPQVDGLVLGDLSDEAVREYETHGVGTYRIENPIGVYIRPGGTTHRVIDSKGIAHCVAFPNEGKTVVRWQNRDLSEPCKW